MKKITLKSDLRTFSLIWSGLFSILSFYPYFLGWHKFVFFSLALIFISIAQIKPELMKGIYKLWVKFGNSMKCYI